VATESILPHWPVSLNRRRSKPALLRHNTSRDGGSGPNNRRRNFGLERAHRLASEAGILLGISCRAAATAWLAQERKTKVAGAGLGERVSAPAIRKGDL
jgi:hypothetical protein